MPTTCGRLPALGVQLLRTGDEVEARTVLERAFAIDKFDQTTFNLLTMLDSLEKFEVITDGNIVIKVHPSEMPVMREYLLPLAQEALGDVFEEVSVHAQGADSDRDVSQARRLRRAHGGTARDDRRARRLFWPRGDARFAEGTAARRFQLGADVVARARARHDAAAVETACASVADGRHLDLRGKARVTRVGTRRRAEFAMAYGQDST